MRKSKNGVWDDSFEFDGMNPNHPLNEWEDEEAEVFLEEAHEALSRLVNKTHKRGKFVKASRRGEVWH